MRRGPRLSVLAACTVALMASAHGRPRFNKKRCTFHGMKLWGKVKVVDAFPDLKVQVVDAFPDLKVKKVDAFPDSCGRWQFVDAFPDSCGRWQFVDAFPDLKVQFVTAFPDLKIQYVDAFPGTD